MGKKQLFLMSVLLVLGLTGCGDKVKPVSLSDDSAIKAQSEAVIEQSKAVVEESKALEKAKGNSDKVEETEPEKPVSSGEISHPFLILECEGEKFDMANDTVQDLVQLWQKTGTHFGGRLSEKLEPYVSAYEDIRYKIGVDWCSASVYNPYNKELTLKDAKIGGHSSKSLWTIEFEKGVPVNLKFLNGKANFNSTLEEWMEVFKEEAEIVWDDGAYSEARDIASKKDEKYTGPKPPEDNYANVLIYNFKDDNNWTIDYGFRLDDGREVYVYLKGGNDGKASLIKFIFDPHFE